MLSGRPHSHIAFQCPAGRDTLYERSIIHNDGPGDNEITNADTGLHGIAICSPVLDSLRIEDDKVSIGALLKPSFPAGSLPGCLEPLRRHKGQLTNSLEQR